MLLASAARLGRLSPAVRSPSELRTFYEFLFSIGSTAGWGQPALPKTGESGWCSTFLQSSCPQVLGCAPCPHVTVPTYPLEGSAFAGRDGCPQPSVRRVSCAPSTSFYSRSGQRRVGDNPPYPRPRESRAIPLSNPPYLGRREIKGEPQPRWKSVPQSANGRDAVAPLPQNNLAMGFPTPVIGRVDRG